MDFFEVIGTRYSCRAYKPDAVSEDALLKILEAARIAPSGSNQQPWRFVVVRDEKTRRRLVPACKGQEFVGEAPVVIVACGVPFKTNRGDWMGWHGMLLDIAIAVDHMQLAARALGLDSCWIGSFNADAVREILGIPEDVKVVALLPVGWAADGKEPKARKPLGEIVCREKYA